MIKRNLMRFVVAVEVVVIVALALSAGAVVGAVGGCATQGVAGVAKAVGPEVEQSAKEIKATRGGIAGANWVKKGNAQLGPDGKALEDPASATISLDGPGTSLTELDGEGVSHAGSGAEGTSFLVRNGDGDVYSGHSSSVITATKTKTTKKDGTVVEEFTMNSDPTKPTEAYAGQIAAATEYMLGLSRDKRDAVIEGVKANSEAVKASMAQMPGLWELLRAAIVGV